MSGSDSAVGYDPNALELQRARRRLEDWCRRRNTAAADAWYPQAGEGGLLLRDASGAAVLRLCCGAAGWQLSVPSAAGWHPYPPLPEADGIDAVIAELEQAPLHVHW